MTARHPFEEIAKRLRSEILTGKRKPGEPLPSENALKDEWKVSRMTVQRAMEDLVAEGLAVTVPKRGVFVRGYDRTAQAVELDTINREFGATVEVAVVDTPPAMEDPNEVEPGVFRRRLIGDSIRDTYWSRAVTSKIPELTRPAPLDKADLLLLVDAGMLPIKAKANVVARMPTHEESTTLALPRATPVLEQVVWLLVGRRLVGMRVEVYPGDRTVLQYDLVALDGPKT
ncbi:GntR family transcriptional regulator [Nonomuraea candida]|uniref:GntR family transcriptional regulator n=1 Tax=Nonomuraea candida TaxID=359159 RepID=UPI0005BE8C96|nr:GntR family transcriptional regulator [Nonomuraea candida]